MLRRRSGENNLLSLLQHYCKTASKIEGTINPRTITTWINLSQVYERGSQFDFIAYL
jgi:hypothetical protein